MHIKSVSTNALIIFFRIKTTAAVFVLFVANITFTKHRKLITDFVKSAYFNYFKVNICNLQELWVPNTVCQNCVVFLRQWSNGKRSSLKIKTPMIWQEPRNNHDDCYFLCDEHYRYKLTGPSSLSDIVFCSVVSYTL